MRACVRACVRERILSADRSSPLFFDMRKALLLRWLKPGVRRPSLKETGFWVRARVTRPRQSEFVPGLVHQARCPWAEQGTRSARVMSCADVQALGRAARRRGRQHTQPPAQPGTHQPCVPRSPRAGRLGERSTAHRPTGAAQRDGWGHKSAAHAHQGREAAQEEARGRHRVSTCSVACTQRLLHRNASVVGAGSGARGEAGRQQRRPTDLRGVPARIAPGARASWWAISPPACSSRPAGEHMLPTGCRYHLSARACNLSVQTPTARSRTCHGQTRSMYDGKEADKEERRRLLAVWPCGWTWESL